jgi:hypothetical protein
MPASQAGRRRFEPGLPLQLFNDLASAEFKACSKMLQNPLAPDAPVAEGHTLL